MKASNEVQALLNIIKVYFHPKSELDRPLFEKINWKKLEQILEFHALRPIVYETLKTAGIYVPSDVLARLETFSTSQAVAHLSNFMELKRLATIFKKEAIPMVPFKGAVYQNALYAKGFREAGDIDILISKKSLERTLNLLLNEGYKYSIDIKGTPTEITQNLILANEQYEIPLYKLNFHIDLHWDIHYGFLPYSVPKDYIFGLQNDTEIIFWTMLNHHGAKEFWLRLKGLVDFGLFISKFKKELDWQQIMIQSENFKMRTVLLNGFYLLKHFHLTEIPSDMEHALRIHSYLSIAKTEKYWSRGASWSTPFERFNFEQILFLSQDKGFRKSEYFKSVYLAFSKPNSIEQHRLITFPERFHFLNFLSKVFSYLIKKTFGIK